MDEGLELFAKSEVGTIYIADSFGHFYREQMQAMLEKYQRFTKDTGKEVGVHCHNNQQLAFANTIEGAIAGATMLDATMAGMGRGAGNCQLELLLGFLHNPKYHVRPILECIQEHIEPMREKLLWGFDLPYMITGVLNQHPRAAMGFNASKDRGNVVKFYDEITLE